MRLPHAFALALAAATVSAGALPVAAQMAAPAFDAAKIPAGRYKVDSGHTQVVFTLLHLGVSEYTGQFTQPTGYLQLDPAHPANDKVEISFPIAKVSTTVAALDAHLQKPEFFDAAQFPEGRFVSKRVSIEGSRAVIQGDLTLKGVTKPVTLQARLVGAGTNPMSKKINIGFHATTSINRSEWGVSYGVPMVGDKTDLVINAAFEAE